MVRLPPRRRSLLLLLLAAGVAVAVWPVPAGSAGPPPPRLGAAVEAHADDVGDPYVLPVPGGLPGDASARYLLLWTTDWRSNVPAAASADLRHWHRLPDALPQLPAWATPDRTTTWAPSATAVPGGWALYFSTRDAASGRQCLGVARASSPAGPYRDVSGAPLVCQAELGGSIDPSVVHAPRGRLALVWKNDGNATGAPVTIWEQELTPDGTAVTGDRHALLTAGAAHEGGIVEGPALLRASTGGWWLFFSVGAWQSATYSTGTAWCETLAGPCREVTERPLLASQPGRVSPGGLDTFRATDGSLWASYSTFPAAPANPREAMRMNRVLQLAPVLSH